MSIDKHTYNHGFKIPENYFDDVEERILESLILSEELSKDAGFTVPENYFEKVEHVISEQVIPINHKKKVFSLPIKKVVIWSVGIAACVTLLFVAFYPNNISTIDQLDIAEIETYMGSEEIDFSNDELALLLNEDSLDNLSSDTELLTSEENLEDYLLNNIDDTTLLIE